MLLSTSIYDHEFSKELGAVVMCAVLKRRQFMNMLPVRLAVSITSIFI